MKILSGLLNTRNVPYRNKNVKLDLFDLAHEKEARDLYYAQDVIGNYAKANHSKITFQEAGERINDPSLKDYLYIKVNRDKNQAKLNEQLPDEAIIKYSSDSDEKPFLRRVYETIQTLMGCPASPIEKHSRETYSKLVQSGKIL